MSFLEKLTTQGQGSTLQIKTSQSVVGRDSRTCEKNTTVKEWRGMNDSHAGCNLLQKHRKTNLIKPDIPKGGNEVMKMVSPSCFPRNRSRKFGYSQSRGRVETAPLPLPEILNFRTVVGRLETLLQMLAPHLRRQSSRYREAQSSVLQPL